MLPTRNLILNLARREKLRYALILPDQDVRLTKKLYQDILRRIADPAIFEFVWRDAGIYLDEDDLTYYPHVGDAELADVSDYPLPHDHIWIETMVKHPLGRDMILIWDIQETEATGGYNAKPLAFRDNQLKFAGYEIDFLREAVNENGSRGAFHMWCHFPDYDKSYDPFEFEDEALMLGRFLRLLCLPGVRKEVKETTKAVNMGLGKQVHSVRAPRTIVTIDHAALLEGLPETKATGTHASPRPHHRRAHLRRLMDGRTVFVRESIVGRTDEQDMPKPQIFRVK